MLGLALLSLGTGAAAGGVGALFRLSLAAADRGRDLAIAWARGGGLAGLLGVMAAAAALTALAAWLVRRFAPQASGSGIPHVECVLAGELPPAPARLIPIKFAGGALAIGSGLALGREGPSVQIGASLAHLVGRAFGRSDADCRVLLAAGAGAGLATAFSAPIAGAVFVLEELLRRFDARTTIATFGASAGAIAVSGLLLGQAPDFQVEPLPYPPLGTLPVHLALGLLAGLLGVVYNRALLGTLARTERLRRGAPEGFAALVGAGVGLLAWFAPEWVGGGDAITQRTLAGGGALGATALAFLLRLGLGSVCYAAGTPGGLFAPMLVLGAQAGRVFAGVSGAWLPAAAASPTACAVVGMAAFFTAVVRAPLTGIVLVIEMTGSFALLVPMLSACFAAMLLPTLLGNVPIYESLRARTAVTLRGSPSEASTMRSLLAALLLGLVIAPGAARAERIVDGIAAQVGSEIVLLSDVMAVAGPTVEKARAAGASDADIRELYSQVLDQMIERALIRQVAKRTEITVSDAEVDAAIAQIARENQITPERLQESVVAQGMPYAVYRERIRDEIQHAKVMNDVVASKVRVNEGEVRALYDEQLAKQPTGGEEFSLRLIVVTVKDDKPEAKAVACARVREAMARIAAGESFEAVAREVSESNPEQGGAQGWVHESQLAAWMRPKIQGLPTGGVSDVVESDFGCAIIQVADRHAFVPMPYESAKARLSDALFQQAVAKEYADFIEKLRANTYIERKGIFAEGNENAPLPDSEGF